MDLVSNIFGIMIYSCWIALSMGGIIYTNKMNSSIFKIISYPICIVAVIVGFIKFFGILGFTL